MRETTNSRLFERIREAQLGALLALTMLASMSTPGRAQSGGAGPVAAALQSAAMKWRPAGSEEGALEIARLEEELTFWGQLDYSARLRPLLRYRDYPGDGTGGNLTGRFTVSARVDLATPPATRARAAQRLEAARHKLALLELYAIRDALLAHSKLLLAQEQEGQAQRALAAAEADYLAAEEGLAIRQAKLELRLASLDLRRAEVELERARKEAAGYGLTGRAGYDSVRFLLSEHAAEAEHTHEYRTLELELQEAEAELSEAKAAPLDDLRVRAGYRGRGAGIDLEGGIVNGRPRANLGLSVPGGAARWEFEVRAEVVLDDSWREFPRLEEAVGAARLEMGRFAARFSGELERTLIEADISEQALDLAEEDVALKEEMLAERLAHRASLLAPSEGAEVSNAGPREIERAEQAVAKAERDVSRARARLYRVWTAYVKDVGEVLELTGGSWQLHQAAVRSVD